MEKKSNELIKWECAECAKSPDYDCIKHFRQSFEPVRASCTWFGIICPGCNFLRDDVAEKHGKKPSSMISRYFCSDEMKRHHYHEVYLCLNCNSPSQDFKDKCPIKQKVLVPLTPFLLRTLISIIMEYYG